MRQGFGKRSPSALATEPEVTEVGASDARAVYAALRAEASARKFSWGIEPLDKLTRGIRAERLHIIGGPTHGGKTVLGINMVLANPSARVLWISPDEGPEYVLQKMVATTLGLTDDELEVRLRDDDDEVLGVLEQLTGRIRLSESDRLGDITGMANKWNRDTGEMPDMVVFDYLDKLAGYFDSEQKANALKGWGRENGVTMVVVHQSNKSAIDKKVLPNLSDLRGAGASESFSVLWAKRPYVDPDSSYDVHAEERQPSFEAYVLKAKSGRTQETSPIKLAIEPGGRLAEWTKTHSDRAHGKIT